MALITATFPDTWMALGLAVHFVARQEPFGSFATRDLVRTLTRQIEQKHYLFALDTDQSPARVVGYFGWALYDNATAEQFLATGKPPAQELASGGDVIWVLTAVAANRRAIMAMASKARETYPKHRVLGIRHKTGGGHVVFDQDRDRVARRRNG